MIVIKRLLLPTDFSELSAHAAEYGRFLAQTHGAEVHLLHVVAPPPASGNLALGVEGAPIPTGPELDVLVESARTRMAAFAAAELPDVDPQTDVVIGVPHVEICDYARRNACDLIVIGSHARGVVRRIFLGSVSKAVLEHSPCPLLMVPLRAVEAPRRDAE